MNWGLVVLLTAAISTIFIIIQRTEARRRRAVTWFMLLFFPVIIWYTSRRDGWGELIAALVIALVLNFLFWVLIGRYNPVGSSDDIRVLGLDD
jgi:uncharacterized membrane protein YhaH (DUF805 family)